MELPKSFPTQGLYLAAIAFVGLLLFGIDIFLSLGVIILWVGSLFLVTSNPPEPISRTNGEAFSREEMGDLIENSSTPLLVTEKTKVTIANRSARKLLGSHILGQDMRVALRHPEAIALLDQKHDGMALVRGLVRRRDIWRINRQNIGDDMAVIELINKTAEEDISRAHTDFVANASHELRTPLSSIVGYVETLREGNGDLEPETRGKFLETIQLESKRLQNLVSDLMSLSRVEAEKHEQPRQRLDFAPLIKRAANDAAGPDRLGRLEVSVDEAITIRGDEKQLEQLVRNLVDNALKYGREGSSVKVELAKSSDGEAQLSVADEGEGIAEEHLPHLTRRFYRTDPGRSRASGGTGLGLAIVKHIVERHRGRLDIESKLGEGTTITVRIPSIQEGN